MVRASKKQYTLREKHLYDTYVKVMNIAQQEKAVKQGVMFDLLYVNGHLQRQFAFLRKADNEVLLVVVNFEDQQVLVNVNIPAHAFGFLKMKEKEVTATDLLTKQRQHFRLASDETVSLELEPLGAKVLRFKV